MSSACLYLADQISPFLVKIYSNLTDYDSRGFWKKKVVIEV